MQQQLDNLFGALTQGSGPQVTPLAFLMLMAVSLLSSLFIAYLYVHFYSNRATGSQVHRAFPLLGISITAIFVTIQFSLPLSLGLLGALSIVRFRTPIKEPEEIGFIMLVIADVDRGGDLQAVVRRGHLHRRARRAVRSVADAPVDGRRRPTARS